ncbi:hypothetical protein LOD99_7218 [Oopsacas minuta]|uniref:Eukaryotic translation initiation factor 3 subunit K n=1 Tax=Oopsacas minuta TaxID=111878 RepID=A0AAV7JU47_9METZ|nr:hypothetical protein LOD99_7218 [Oopsacas minuta]
MEEIKDILSNSKEKSNPGKSEVLQQFVLTQSKENTYCKEANIILLKMYTLFPECHHNLTVCLILLKALAALPETDFVLCKSLIPHNKHNDSGIARIFKMHQFLERCQFNEFWLYLKENEDIIKGVTGFKESILTYIKGVIKLTYKSLHRDMLSKLLYTKGKELDQLIAKEGWKLKENGTVEVRSSADFAAIASKQYSSFKEFSVQSISNSLYLDMNQ